MATSNSTEKINLELSIQVSLDGLSFCTLNSVDNEVVDIKKIRFTQQLDPVNILAEIEKTL